MKTFTLYIVMMHRGSAHDQKCIYYLKVKKNIETEHNRIIKMPDTIKTQIQQFKGDLCAFKVGVVQ